jgi:hypothetical protein
MEIFDNSFKEGVTEDVLTAMTILGTARKETKKQFMDNLNPEDTFAKQLQVVDEEYKKAIERKASEGKLGQADPPPAEKKSEGEVAAQ